MLDRPHHACTASKNIEAFHAWRADPSQCLPAAIDIARSHGLPHADPQLFSTGTNLVVALDDRLILKIFPPLLRHQFVSERGSRCRSSADGCPCPIPEIVLEGERDRWPYLVITRLHGRCRIAGLADFAGRCRRSACSGKSARRSRKCSGCRLANCSASSRAGTAFISGQIERCRARHERLGLPQKYLDGLDDLLRDAAALIPIDAPPVILTGEYIPENFLLSRESGSWRLAGLIDFGDVLTGWGEYDLLGPSVFMAAGMPRRVASFFTASDIRQEDITPALTRRLVALMLLHRFSDLNRQICIEGWQQKAADLSGLERLLWPI